MIRRVPRWAVDLVLAAAALVDALLFLQPVWWQWVAAVLAGGGLMVRRRFPVVAAVLAMVGLFLAGAAVAAVVALFTLASRATPRWVLVLFGVVALVGQTSFFDGPLPVDIAVLDVIYAVLYVAGPISLGLLVQVRDQLHARIADLRAAQAEVEAAAGQEAVARERAQLAREMHDVVSHQVSLIAVRAGALQVTTRDGAAAEAARDIRALSVTTLEELRQMVGVLRASTGSGTELVPQPGLGDVEQLVAGAGFPVALQLDVDGDLPAPVQRAVYRTVQEGLTNVRKHAPGSPVEVSVRRTGTELEVVVANGPASVRPLALPGSGHGLVGLRERADMLAGELDVGPAPDGGHILTLRVPVH